MSDVEPIIFRPGKKGVSSQTATSSKAAVANLNPRSLANGRRSLKPPANNPPAVRFDRIELNQILNVYGRKVASGDWRDYAMDFGKDTAVFSVFRRSSETPLYRIEKSPKLARKQGAYAVVSRHGLILKRGHNLLRVLNVLDKSVRLVEC